MLARSHAAGERAGVCVCARESEGEGAGGEETHLSGHWEGPLTASAPVSWAVGVGGGSQVHRAPRR